MTTLKDLNSINKRNRQTHIDLNRYVEFKNGKDNNLYVYLNHFDPQWGDKTNLIMSLVTWGNNKVLFNINYLAEKACSLYRNLDFTFEF